MITLDGCGLGPVIDAVQDDEAKVLSCFTPARFANVPPIGEPVITATKRQSLREFAGAPAADPAEE